MARVRVYPEFADLQSAHGTADADDVETHQPPSTPSSPRLLQPSVTHGTMVELQRGLSEFERAFSHLSRALSRADNLSFAVSISRQDSDALSDSEPAWEGQLSDSDENDSGRVVERSPPQATLLSKLRLWLAAYVSVADYVTDVYTISVRP